MFLKQIGAHLFILYSVPWRANLIQQMQHYPLLSPSPLHSPKPCPFPPSVLPSLYPDQWHMLAVLIVGLVTFVLTTPPRPCERDPRDGYLSCTIPSPFHFPHAPIDRLLFASVSTSGYNSTLLSCNSDSLLHIISLPTLLKIPKQSI